MPVKRHRIVVIVGPTSSGKSELAVRVAKKINGEIISADSRQIYRELDIGTGKVEGKWQQRAKNRKTKIFIYKNIPHYCIDFISPKKIYTVTKYKQCAKAAINDITKRGKIPIIAGGTGFWIDTVIYNLDFPKVAPNQKLRKELTHKSAAELLRILQKLDPKRASLIDQRNPRRLIRAIEIAETIGHVPLLKKSLPYKTLILGIKITPDKLKKRIHKKLLQRIKNGMIAEAKRVKHNGLSWKRFYELGLQYRFLADYLRRKVKKQDMIENLEKAINQYARRQMVWFKKNKEIKWINNYKDARKLIRKFLDST